MRWVEVTDVAGPSSIHPPERLLQLFQLIVHISGKQTKLPGLVLMTSGDIFSARTISVLVRYGDFVLTELIGEMWKCVNTAEHWSLFLPFPS